MATQYVEITDEIKESLLKLADGQFMVKDRVKHGEPVREYQDITPQFKSFPVKYILEGIEAGNSPEEISDDIYYFMKYGKSPEEIRKNINNNPLYRGVSATAYTEGPDNNDQENMLRFICGKVSIELNKLIAP